MRLELAIELDDKQERGLKNLVEYRNASLTVYSQLTSAEVAGIMLRSILNHLAYKRHNCVIEIVTTWRDPIAKATEGKRGN